jgi:hypothetical protein
MKQILNARSIDLMRISRARGSRKPPPLIEAWLSYFLHQDNLMWNRLQTIGVIQIAVWSSAYAVRSNVWFSICILGFGLALTLIICLLMQRDDDYRRDIEKRLGTLNIDPPKRWCSFLRGESAAFIIYGMILAAYIALGILILRGCLDP